MYPFKFLIVLFVVLLVSACDKIDFPLQVTTGSDTITVKKSFRKILLEDYTGHQCGNCPAAAEVADNLHQQYGDSLVVIAVHAGFFARTSAKYPTSYTTTASVEWDKDFIGNSGNPNGMVNRKNYNNNGLVHSHSKWNTVTSLASRDTHFVDLKLTTQYDIAARRLSVTAKAKFLLPYRNNTKISVVLAEDSVIGPQTDYRRTPQDVQNYVFMHMLREEINGTWGTTLKSMPINSNDSVSVSFPDYQIKKVTKDKNAVVVAFIFDDKTREVLQVEKAHFYQKD